MNSDADLLRNEIVDRKARRNTKEFQSEVTSEIQIDGGSFKDPSGVVFTLDGELYRSLDAPTAQLMRRMESEGVFRALHEAGHMVRSRTVTEDDPIRCRLQDLVPGASSFLHHERISFVSYPYEWTHTMLADAGRLHVELQLKLLERGYSLKDASAFNVLFDGCRPVFIDVASIEIPKRNDLWIAYGQFCRMFLFPLLLRKYAGYNTKACFMTDLNGISVEEAYDVLGFPAVLRPALFVDVFLQKMLQKPGQRASVYIIEKRHVDSASQVMNLNRLLGKMKTLAKAGKARGYWTDYENTSSYSDEVEPKKTGFVREFLATNKPGSVLDIGCNTGKYSILAAESGAATVAMDMDYDCVDLVYRKAKAQDLRISPLWMDIANPSPALGFNNMERKSFFDRINVDCVFAFALIHHLLVTCRLPLKAIRDLLLELAGKWLVIEFVAPEDPMFQALLALREDIYGHINREHFEATFGEYFDVVKREEIMPARTLYVFKKRHNGSRSLVSISCS